MAAVPPARAPGVPWLCVPAGQKAVPGGGEAVCEEGWWSVEPAVRVVAECETPRSQFVKLWPWDVSRWRGESPLCCLLSVGLLSLK